MSTTKATLISLIMTSKFMESMAVLIVLKMVKEVSVTNMTNLECFQLLEHGKAKIFI